MMLPNGYVYGYNVRGPDDGGCGLGWAGQVSCVEGKGEPELG